MTNNDFTFEQDFDRYEGGLVWKNAKTLKRYKELSEQHAPAKGWFAAFSDKQFSEGLSDLISKGLKAMVDFYRERDKRIAEECDPQEVYCVEFNNHECMIAYDGDLEAMRLCIDLFGADRCQSIKRFCSFYTFEHIAKEVAE